MASEGYEYWRQREEENLKRLEREEKRWQKEIDEIYERMIMEIDDEIQLFFSRYANAVEMTMADARKYLDSIDIEYYSERAKYYCELAAKDFAEDTDKRAQIYFSDEANEEMLRYNAAMRINRLEMIKSQMKLRLLKAQSKAEETIDMAVLKRSEDTFKRQAGILGETVLHDMETLVETIRSASFHGAKFSERIWGKQQTQLQKALNKALTDCLVLGKGAAPFSQKLERIGKTTKYQASRLMRTELARVQAQAEQAAYEKCGFTDFVFLTNPRCCPSCHDLEGTHHPNKDMKPGKNAPPLHPNCRCFTAPWIERKPDKYSDEEIADFDEWSATFDDHGLSWQEWKGRQWKCRS